jgi:ketosteroid isomerase-like protein
LDRLPADPIPSVTLVLVPELVTDSLFAGCRIQGVAGRGGMGIVYRATQLPLGRAVALKLVSPERAAEPAFRARFERESRLAAAIDHPNVIPIYAAGEEDGSLFIVMRWVRGQDLQALIARTGGLDPKRTASIVAQVGAGLDAAHQAGLVHRDVKPANVLIAGDEGTGHVYLSDFGLTREVTADTRITESGEWLGTVNFMAPEQFEGARVDSRTDVYALGCLLYAALCGQAPFAGRTVAATMLAHLDEPPPKPSAKPAVPAAFDAVVARAMAKRPVDRYASAGELVEATQAAAELPRDRPVRPDARNGAEAAPEADDAERAATEIQQSSTSAGTARISRAGGRPPRVALLGGAAALGLAAVAAGALFAAGPLADEDSRNRVSEADVRSAVEDFSGAYADEDTEAMAEVLTGDVARITTADTQRGRANVLRAYRRQFASNATEDYALEDMSLRPGGVGRASGRYEVSRGDHTPIRGRVVFGVERDGDRPRIGLIALTPDS